MGGPTTQRIRITFAEEVLGVQAKVYEIGGYLGGTVEGEGNCQCC